MSRRSAIRTARMGQLEPGAAAFWILYVILGLWLGNLLEHFLLKVCKGNEKIADPILFFILWLITKALYTLLTPPIVYLRTNLVDFLFGH